MARTRPHNRLGHEWCTVQGAEGQIEVWITWLITKHAVMQHKRPVQQCRMGVQQQLVRVKPMAVLRFIGSIGPQAVALPCPKPCHMRVEDIAGASGQEELGNLSLAGFVKQAERDALCVG